MALNKCINCHLLYMLYKYAGQNPVQNFNTTEFTWGLHISVLDYYLQSGSYYIRHIVFAIGR